jgi:hypothetical protein
MYVKPRKTQLQPLDEWKMKAGLLYNHILMYNKKEKTQ